MRTVLTTTKTQPNRLSASNDAATCGFATCHTTTGIGCHCQNRNASARLENKTKVLRSTVGGTIRVHHFLNRGRAITLCWIANNDINNKLMMMACIGGPASPEAMVFGIITHVDKPIE